MKVALYNGDNDLPFWRSPANPNMLFNPKKLRGWRWYDNRVGINKIYPANKCPLLRVLKGLYAIELPGVMVHVSIKFEPETKTIYEPTKFGVQISTEPEMFDKFGLPVVVQIGIVQVLKLWAGDADSCTQFDILKSEQLADQPPQEFWTLYFTQELQEERRDAFAKAKMQIFQAGELKKLYSLIPV